MRIGVDAGSVRVGIALSDPDGMLATPYATEVRDPSGRTRPDLAAIVTLAAERDALEVVVGLPRSLSGGEGPAAATARRYAAELAAEIAAAGLEIPVRLADERLSTVQADRLIRSGAGNRKARRRTVIDQAAAVGILQAALDSERATGSPGGEALG